jgi:hypothetical protein
MKKSLKQVLLEFYKDEMISFLKQNPGKFDEAVEAAVSDEQPYAWRAAWLVGNCMKKNDVRVENRIKDILDVIPDKSDGYRRELLKILLNMDLDEEHEGLLFNICMDIWEEIGSKPSVRIIALKNILKISKKHPELAQEIHFLTEGQYLETLTPGIRSSASKLMDEFIEKTAGK